MVLYRRIGIYVATIYISTFVLVLPLLCHKLGFSTYFNKPKEPYKYLEAENKERTEEARKYFNSLYKSTTTFPQYGEKVQIDFSIVLLTAHRGSNTHYSLQVASRLLPQVISDEGRSVLTILNSDPQPGMNEDAAYLSNFIAVVNSSLPVTSASRSREKEDYVVGLEIGVRHNSTYVLMIEDDALPSERLLGHLRYVLTYKMPGKFLKSRRDWVFLKLYYPEKWQGFGWPELPELVLIGILGGSLAVWVQLKMRTTTRRKVSLCCTFTVWGVYVILVVYTVGRAHWIELRKLSPVMYSVVKAPGCCTPGVLYPRSHARNLANFLKSVQCSEKYPMDVAIDDFANKMNLERYLVIPNMISHIGVHSSLGSRMKHFAEFYLMFKP